RQRVEAHANESGVAREHRAVDGVDVLELLAHESQREVVHPVPAAALRKADAGKAEGRELGEDLGVVAAGAIVGRDVRRELLRAEVADGVDQLLLVRSEPQLQHATRLVRLVATHGGSGGREGLIVATIHPFRARECAIVATNGGSWGPKGLIVATNGDCGGARSADKSRLSRFML